jgi:lipopolysaccharide transport system permease protein
MGVMMIWYRFAPDWHLLALPFFVLLSFAFSFGVGLWFAALNVEYRDFRHIIPFVVQFGLYISPVGFSSSIIPARWRLLYSFNPVVGVIDGFRWSLLRGQSAIWLPGLLISIVLTFAICAGGIWYFRKTERTFADVI